MSKSLEEQIKAKAKTFPEAMSDDYPAWLSNKEEFPKRFLILDDVLVLVQKDREEHNKKLQERIRQAMKNGVLFGKGNKNVPGGLSIQFSDEDIDKFLKKIMEVQSHE